MFGIGVVMTSVFTLLTPLAANHSVWLLVAVRVLEGFFEVSYFLQSQVDHVHMDCALWVTSP